MPTIILILNNFDYICTQITKNMGLFNRYNYRADYQDLECSFRESDDIYCNPKDYSVTEDECSLYLKNLARGNKLNDEWNKKRRIKRELRWRWTIFIIGVILFFGISSLIFIWFDINDFAERLGVSIYSFQAVAGASVWVYGKVEEQFQDSKIFYSIFYPKVNENIERLFDDYLWKHKLLREAEEKGNEEWQKVHKELVRKSHPGLDQFIEAVEEELNNPSENCVIGDVQFGMTAEEIYNTKVFAGLTLANSYNDIHLGYRSRYLRRFFAIQYPCVSFRLENNRLVKLIITTSFNESKAVIEPFISCCEKLNQYYGNPCNLKRRFIGEGFELAPYDKAEFRVGKKSVLLHVEKTGDFYSRDTRFNVKLEFSIVSTTSNRRVEESNQSFDKRWFDELRKWCSYKAPYCPDPLEDCYLYDPL